MNVDKNFRDYFKDEPPGLKTNAIRWFQKKVMQQALTLPQDFSSREEWEGFKENIRVELPSIIGFPALPPMQEGYVRGRIKVGRNVVCERIDIYMDEDYSMPALVYSPMHQSDQQLPGLVWSPGWPQNIWETSYQKFAVRMAEQGYVVAVIDHAPFGETSFEGSLTNMTLFMSMGHLLGISQLAVRAVETMRAGEYLRARHDVDEERVAVAGLCQGGMDTYLAAALDDRFCGVAAFCAESTFAIHMAEMASYWANGDSSPFPFGILKICDIEHLHGCIAPRPLLVRANLGDCWWPVSGYNDVESFTGKIYRLYDAEDKMDFAAEVHEHNLTGPFADALEKFLITYV